MDKMLMLYLPHKSQYLVKEERCVTVDTIRDNVYERPEQLFVELQSSSEAFQLTTQLVAVIISDSMFDSKLYKIVCIESLATS